MSLDENPRPKSLPEGIGEWMPEMRTIFLKDVKLEKIPGSLVYTLFENMVREYARGVPMSRREIYVTNDIPIEVLERELHHDRFLAPAAWYRDGRDLQWWENTLVHFVDKFELDKVGL